MYNVSGHAFAEKPYSGIVTPTRLYDATRFKNHGVHTNVTMVQLPKGLWVRELTGSATSYIDVGNINRLVKAALLWVYPDDITSRSFMDLDGGTHSLETDANGDITATGWSSPTFNVNGVDGDTRLTVSKWNFIVVKTSTAFLASDFDIGREAAAYWDGMVALVGLLGYPPSPGLMKNIYEKQLRDWFI